MAYLNQIFQMTNATFNQFQFVEIKEKKNVWKLKDIYMAYLNQIYFKYKIQSISICWKKKKNPVKKLTRMCSFMPG